MQLLSRFDVFRCKTLLLFQSKRLLRILVHFTFRTPTPVAVARSSCEQLLNLEFTLNLNLRLPTHVYCDA